MATIDWKQVYGKLGKRTEWYALAVRDTFQQRIGEIIAMCEGLELEEGKPFAFADYEIAPKVEKKLRQLYAEVYRSIRGNIVREWNYANDTTDKLLKGLFGKESIEDSHYARFFQRNKQAMQQFLTRQTNGLDLSQRVWQYVGQTRTDLEAALDLGLGQGLSADTLSRQVREYLQNPDDLFRRFRYKKGEDAEGNPIYGRKWKRRCYDKDTDSFYWVDSNPKDYHTGTGVYRSSYKNAMRLTRTETNMAYRSADITRWQQLPFVLGYEVKMSKNHPCTDICDELAGTYPKEFRFTGWHPHCYCYIVPLLCNDEELEQLTEQILRGEDTEGFTPAGVVSEMPSQFTNWIASNTDRIQAAQSLPYFIRDNYKGGNIANGFKWIDENHASGHNTPTTAHVTEAVPKPTQVTPISTTKDKAEDLFNTLPADIERYDRTIPTDPSGNTDIGEYRKKIAELLQSAGCYTGTNVTRLASFKTKAELDNWYKQSLKIANIDALDKATDTVNKLLAKGTFKGQPFQVLRQAHTFLTQYHDYMAAGEYVKATNALRGFINLNDLIKAKVDFSTVSMLMPKELLEADVWFNGSKANLDKGFFDLLSDYVPVKIGKGKKGSTHYSPAERIVELWAGDSRYNSSWYKHKAIYHEYGHAIDHQRDLCHNSQLLAVWDKYEKLMQAKSKFGVFEGGKIVERELTLFEYAETMLPYYRDSIYWGKAKDTVLKRLQMERTDIRSQAACIADTINSLSKGKYGYGHDSKYWRTPNATIKEFIAHAFENEYIGNRFFEWFYKDLYEEMIKVLRECL